MKILVYKWDIYPYNTIITTLEKQGHQVDVLAFPILNPFEDAKFEAAFLSQLTNEYDFVFSVNYFAVIGRICAQHNLIYISWTCDSPLISLTDDSALEETNHIFLFDKSGYEKLILKGAKSVYYLPLAGSAQSTDNRQPRDKNYSIDENRDFNHATFTPPKEDFSYDISFVGNLYDKNRYDEMCLYLPDYLCGYMDAAIEAQKNISGGYILPEMLDSEILTKLMKYTNFSDGSTSIENLKLHFATTVLAHKVVADERSLALNTLALTHKVDLFTTSSGDQLCNVTMHPPVDYHTAMPKVFAASKINLNLTSPNIENGIPLRVFDILSAGGFLLTDYRREICEQFEADKDLVVFEGIHDLQEKVDYYLSHSDERMAIAQNGYKKICKRHLYENRLQYILETVFNQKNKRIQ